jgi:hypothetical protein
MARGVLKALRRRKFLEALAQSRIEEATAILEPTDARIANAINRFGQGPTTGHFDDMQRANFAAADLDRISERPAVFRGLEIHDGVRSSRGLR